MPRGRPRNFDRTEALDRALRVFWSQGYERASIADLTRAMGIASPSLYAAFGDKAALFAEAVARYRAIVEAPILAAIDSETALPAAIEAFLVGSARAFAAPGGVSGSLPVHGAAMVMEADGAGRLLRRVREHTMARLTARLERARLDGDLPDGLDCRGFAAVLGALQTGLAIQARDGADGEALERAVRVALDGVRGILGPSAQRP